MKIIVVYIGVLKTCPPAISLLNILTQKLKIQTILISTGLKEKEIDEYKKKLS